MTSLVCPSCGTPYDESERFCASCRVPLVFGEERSMEAPVSERHERARKVKPQLAEGALVFSGDGTDRQFVVALDATTGRVRWKTDRHVDFYKKFSFSTPLVIGNWGTSGIGISGHVSPETIRQCDEGTEEERLEG